MLGIIDLLLTLLTFAIIGRVILSWIVPMMGARPHPVLLSISNVLFQITEPILAPIRRILPSIGMLDLSPMVALVLVWIIRAVLASQL